MRNKASIQNSSWNLCQPTAGCPTYRYYFQSTLILILHDRERRAISLRCLSFLPVCSGGSRRKYFGSVPPGPNVKPPLFDDRRIAYCRSWLGYFSLHFCTPWRFWICVVRYGFVSSIPRTGTIGYLFCCTCADTTAFQNSDISCGRCSRRINFKDCNCTVGLFKVTFSRYRMHDQ